MENASGMNTLMKSPIKNSLLPVPIRNNQLINSAKTAKSMLNQQNVIGENINVMMMTP